MTSNQQTLLRQWHMLRAVPRAPRKIAVNELHRVLADAGFETTGRTIQRDLQRLSEVFPLVADGVKPFGWSWLRDGASFDLPGLSVPEALTLALVEQQLAHLLPPATLDTLQPHFRSAQQALSAIEPQSQAGGWLAKVRTIPPMQRLQAPVVDDACQRTIYDALARDRQLRLSYRKRDVAEPVEYEVVHPLAVVQRGQLIYLICMFADYEDVRMLAMHRVLAAEMSYLPSRRPAGFCIDAYIAGGHMGVRSGDPIRLRAVFSKTAGEHLFETPIAPDQSLTVLPGQQLELQASVPNTRELHWWLLGLGDGVEVLEPPELRAEIGALAHRMAARYPAPAATQSVAAV
ncbi:putative DNA-binding transcriptional regulator YafY [Duganella sp. 1224]|uniref:helix-turn-helix transcriptional regulator n=1 Tax=Duganella sp. 1224 TaxID=2587052 RepID=UPI0015CEA7A4|nr:WYL domain-containing protein [Duganella sp. 1224]NYE60728.1 putative DNA-binding transcriptional regulator YafY [Duganella sp. 1224]